MNINFKPKFLNKQLLNEITRPGKILSIEYIMIKEDEIKIMKFIGLCIVKKKSCKISLRNIIKKEEIRVLINLDSPLLIKVRPISKYKKRSRLCKFHF